VSEEPSPGDRGAPVYIGSPRPCKALATSPDNRAPLAYDSLNPGGHREAVRWGPPFVDADPSADIERASPDALQAPTRWARGDALSPAFTYVRANP